jgi:hypothetical protein
VRKESAPRSAALFAAIVADGACGGQRLVNIARLDNARFVGSVSPETATVRLQVQPQRAVDSTSRRAAAT